ncbi:MAG: NAD(P)H-binding protein [Myxococcota bacterium]
MAGTDHIAVIGATGRLAIPVLHRWASQGVSVKALVRDVDKARGLLPSGTTLVAADLQNVESLRRGLDGSRFLYLNLSTETLERNRAFYTEHQGIANILQAARGGSIEHILQLSGLGAHPANADVVPDFLPNVVRLRGQALLRESGIPFTLFHATWFLDSLPRFVRNGALMLLGTYPRPFYFTNTTDLADHVRQAMANPRALNRDFAVQGSEALHVDDAAARFVAVTSPKMQIRRIPLWAASAMSVFMPTLRMPVAMTKYLLSFPDKLLAEDTWEVVGRPNLTLERFFDPEYGRP